MLWRLTRGGRVSHLFGTVHVGKPGWQALGPLTAAALRASDTLALEIDPTDPAVLAALADTTPAPRLPEALNQRLLAATQRACLPLLALAGLHPVLQATTLTVLDARWLGLDPNHSLEMLLAQRAKARRMKVVSLESVELQKQVLVPADAAEAVAVIEQALDQLENLASRRVLERLVRAWESGDLATLERYEQWCECAGTDEERAFLRRLNDERNAPLADRIARLHGQGRRVFAAIGALHMTGPAALPRLLAERGFKVERVNFAADPARSAATAIDRVQEPGVPAATASATASATTSAAASAAASAAGPPR
ncbi:MAG: TraB/GumN family protein [Rubrivivax sp.]|nr:TraB/GumN family protein [Rubrivivax sp.]